MADCDVFISSLSFAQADARAMERLIDSGFVIERNPLGRRMTGAEIATHAGQAKVIIAGTDDLGQVAQDSERLKLIVRLGVGLDGVPVEVCKTRGIGIVTTPDAVTAPVAEFALGMILAAERRIVQADQVLRGGGWDRALGRSVSECIVGIVGFGRIGAAVARALAPLGPRQLLVCDVIDRTEVIAGLGQAGIEVTQVDLPTLLATADVVTLHAPVAEGSGPLIDAAALALMKPDATLVNTARGALIDEAALLEVLQARPGFRAALDVFNAEPYSGVLVGAPSVILTSHIASNTTQTRINMDEAVVDAALAFLTATS